MKGGLEGCGGGGGGEQGRVGGRGMTFAQR